MDAKKTASNNTPTKRRRRAPEEPARPARIIVPPPQPAPGRAISTPTTQELLQQEMDQRWGNNQFEPPTPAAREILWRHGHWIKRREKIRQAIERTAKAYKRIARWDACGAHGVVEWSKSRNKPRTTCWHCHDRLCQPCMARRRRDILQIVKNNTRGNTARFVTLTLKHRPQELKEEMKRMRLCFGKLRRSKVWKTYIEGGIAVPETKIGEDGMWHHHVHIVTTGRYLPKEDLVNAWKKATGDSEIVDIQACPNLEATVWYVTKYVTKPVDHSVLNDDAKLIEFVSAMKGQRTWNCFGTWKADTEDHDDKGEDDWKPVCTILELMNARDRQEVWAVDMARQLQRELANLPP